MMKDTLITSRRKKKELITWLVCFIIANLANLYAIIKYNDASFSELFTSLGYVFAASVVLYVAWTIIRLVFCGIRNLIRKPRK